MTTDIIPGAVPYQYLTVTSDDDAEPTDGGVIEEVILSIFVNGQELATMMCSPVDRIPLAIGFLYNEHVIDSIDEIGLVQANATETAVDIMLKRAEFDPPRRMVLTSGCTGGISLQDLTEVHPALESDFVTLPTVIIDRMRDLQGNAHLYNAVRGVHTSVLASEDEVLAAAEDVGRHNTIDKIAGKALQHNITTRDRLMLTSGRISSEMLHKARRLGIPVVASRTAPTSISVNLAEAWNICLIGYVRRGSMRVYTHPWRLGLA
ncbi:MAG: formate dehydrogenase accessory sulfurtransferase FdhD [Chloroflexi bacterium]|nr:formate dehydrogenase accessory sulfurtransferase FdhD [Chloroflexota bacterium]